MAETVPDVPSQYKPLINEAVLTLMACVEEMWPFIQELGDNFECESDGIVVTIKGAENSPSAV